MTPQQSKPSARTYPFVPALLGAALVGALFVNLQAQGMTAQKVFGVDRDFDDV